MFGGLVKQTIAWAKDNCPRSALLSEEQLQARVQQAINETLASRVFVGFLMSVASTLAAIRIFDAAAIESLYSWQGILLALAVYAPIAIIFLRLDQYLLHRRVSLLIE